MENQKYDFGGWATKFNIKCSDGRTIRHDAFKDNDKKRVPLVWNHKHDSASNVLGFADLVHMDEGVYADCAFNTTDNAQDVKIMVEHGDLTSLSIWANQLNQVGLDVLHGDIKEVSLVLAGANPGAFIDSVLAHDGTAQFEAIIYNDETITVLSHSDDAEEDNKETKKEDANDSETDEKKSEEKEEEDGDESISDVYESMTEKQKKAACAMVAQAIEIQKEEQNNDSEGGEEEMKHNAFENENNNNANVLSHSDITSIIEDAKRNGSLRSAVLAHGVSNDSLMHSIEDAAGNTVTYGIANVDYLFPDAVNVNNRPETITRNMEWVPKFFRAARHLPFARVKTISADLTVEDLRARGYVKGDQKVNEVFALSRRSTGPCTVYKKQKIDRDDTIDITDFDVVAWIKGDMRMLLDEEIARAALVGDGRLVGTEGKISEDCIRPIWTDDDVFSIKASITLPANATADDKAKAFIRKCVKARKEYKGSGNPSLFTTEDMLTDCLLLEDGNGRVIYDTEEKLKTALRVKEIVTVPVMENLSRENGGFTFELLGIIVNPADYGFGADKGGAVSMFEDFDIDFNQNKFLIETRCSGALQKLYSAIVIENKVASN